MTFGMTIDCHTDFHTNTKDCLAELILNLNSKSILKNQNINSELINQLIQLINKLIFADIIYFLN